MEKVLNVFEYIQFHAKNKKRAVVEYGEHYDVKINIQNDLGYWHKITVTYYTETRDAHDLVEQRAKKDYPHGEIISVKYL